MEEAIRYTALAITALICVLVLKKAEPNVAIAISLAAAAMVGTAALTAFSVVADFVRERAAVEDTAGIVPILMKVIGTVWITGFGVQTCRDCGEGTLAMQLELLGGVLAFVQVLPLLSAVFTMLESLCALG
ncbi:MAG: stage III sporulation AC/AD family protein [Clostridia bacterium]|nr:stage III sporulation AC/AD family protein [Clostridia bacterium]